MGTETRAQRIQKLATLNFPHSTFTNVPTKLWARQAEKGCYLTQNGLLFKTLLEIRKLYISAVRFHVGKFAYVYM